MGMTISQMRGEAYVSVSRGSLLYCYVATFAPLWNAKNGPKPPKIAFDCEYDDEGDNDGS